MAISTWLGHKGKLKVSNLSSRVDVRGIRRQKRAFDAVEPLINRKCFFCECPPRRHPPNFSGERTTMPPCAVLSIHLGKSSCKYLYSLINSFQDLDNANRFYPDSSLTPFPPSHPSSMQDMQQISLFRAVFPFFPVVLCSDMCPTYGPVFGPLGLQAGGQLDGMDDTLINTLPLHILELDVTKMLWVIVPVLCHPFCTSTEDC